MVVHGEIENCQPFCASTVISSTRNSRRCQSECWNASSRIKNNASLSINFSANPIRSAEAPVPAPRWKGLLAKKHYMGHEHGFYHLQDRAAGSAKVDLCRGSLTRAELSPSWMCASSCCRKVSRTCFTITPAMICAVSVRYSWARSVRML